MDKNYLLQKWLTGELTDDELKEFKKLEDYDQHVKLSETAKKFSASNFIETPDYKALKDRIAANETPVRKLDWFKPFMRIAAVLLLTVGIYFTFFSSNLTQVETAYSEKITATLPDASEVRLNAVSEIEYSEAKWEEKRELTLQGEAYFKVAKGAKFDVHTNTGTVSVLGTQFNVKNRNDFFEVVCYEGKVRVAYDGKTRDLLPGDSYRVLNGAISLHKVKAIQPEWTKNSSIFKEVPFSEVIKELERQYGVSINSNTIDTTRLFNGGFIHTDLDSALQSITLPLGLQYTKESNKIVLNNIAR